MIRIAINGFRCVKETFDDPLERDGKGDEVFFHWAVSEWRSGATAPTVRSGQSCTFGDLNGYWSRFKAGSRSDLGGIRTDDIVPQVVEFRETTIGPGIKVPLPFPRLPWSSSVVVGIPCSFPITIWEGDVNPGDSVTVGPTLHEWDGDSINPGPGIAIVNETARVVGDILCTILFPPGVIISEALHALVDSIVKSLGIAGNRPIGLDPANLKPVDPQNPGGTNLGIPFPSITVTHGTLDAMVSRDVGFGPGVIECGQYDPANIGGGVYKFYVQVSKV